MTFHSIVRLPDVGLQERDHEDLVELKAYIAACIGMDADPLLIRITAAGNNITDLILRDVARERVG